MHNRNHREKKKEEGEENICKEIVTETSQML